MTSCFGGAKRDRTADLLHAMQALSQLSYSPGGVIRMPLFRENHKHYFHGWGCPSGNQGWVSRNRCPDWIPVFLILFHFLRFLRSIP